MNRQYYVLDRDNNRYGPATIAELKDWAAQGRLRRDSRLIDAATNDQIVAESIAELWMAPSAPAASSSYQSAAPSSSKPVDQPSFFQLISPKRFLDWLETGRLFNQIISAVMKLTCGLVVIAAILLLIGGVKLIQDASTESAFAVVIAMLIQFGTMFWLVQVLWIRSEQIRTMPNSDSPIIMVATKVIRTAGESLALYVLGAFTALGVMLIFAPSTSTGMGSAAPGTGLVELLMAAFGATGSGVLGGILMIVLGGIVSVAYLFIAYLVAEAISLGAIACGHLRGIRHVLEERP